MAGDGQRGVDELTGKLAAGALLLVALIAVGSWQRNGFASVDFVALLGAGRDAVTAPEATGESGSTCLRSANRQLDALLTLKQRQRYEWLGAAIGGQPELNSQLLAARHALEEARLNYAHARENVRLGCRARAARL
jgi:hypothetical protein